MSALLSFCLFLKKVASLTAFGKKNHHQKLPYDRKCQVLCRAEAVLCGKALTMCGCQLKEMHLAGSKGRGIKKQVFTAPAKVACHKGQALSSESVLASK